jgi:hypothetical protein
MSLLVDVEAMSEDWLVDVSIAPLVELLVLVLGRVVVSVATELLLSREVGSVAVELGLVLSVVGVVEVLLVPANVSSVVVLLVESRDEDGVDEAVAELLESVEPYVLPVEVELGVVVVAVEPLRLPGLLVLPAALPVVLVVLSFAEELVDP